MNGKRFIPLLATLAVLVAACTQKNTGDLPSTTTDIPAGLNRFLLFPNPLAMNTGGFETNTTEYAAAYYRAIDPTNAKDTIDKWRTQNSFGSGTGTELLAVFRDTKDLGYGRRMTGRMNTDGSVAFYVENYSVTPNASGDYSSLLNVEAAIRRDTRWHVGTNAIEWSSTPCIPGADPSDCNGTIKFAKYYNFSSQDGTRQLAVDLDGNGLKAMPGPCITCHGGRGDPLTPPDASNGKPRFPLVENSVSRKRGDVEARLHGMNVDSFGYSPDIAGFSKADQQAKLKQFNQWILCTYPLAGAVVGAEDNCRVPAGPNEWQGTAAEMIKAWYGGPGMPNGTFLDSYVPAGWASNTSLYTNVVAPYCRTCHILRGTKNQDDIDFTKLGTPAVGPTPATGFQSYADRIKAHVFDRGTMPLALIVYDAFWSSNAPKQLATFINPLLTPPQTVLDTSGAALRPGRPVASPGPNRMVRTGANAILTGEDSLFASSYNWSMVSGSAILANADSMIATFNAPAAGDYVVRLTVSNGSQTDSKSVTITVNDSFPDPQSIKFAHVKNALQNITYVTSQVPLPGKKCVSCHVTPAVSPTPPIFYNSFDRDGSTGAPDATDDAWFLKALQGKVNLTEIEASQLLRKPSGNHHNGLTVLDVSDKSTGGGLSNYSILYNWILAGAPGGGVAGNAIVNNGNLGTQASPVLVTFSGPVGGPYASPNIALDGTTSLGATTYAWTVFGPPGPLGTLPLITNANTSLATLNVFNVGTYVVQLQVSDGVSTDTVQQTIVIDENPIAASFTPSTGNTTVTYSGNPLQGPITLSSTSTGNPTTCFWQILGGPSGALLDGSATLSTAKSCATPATLSVPSNAVGGEYAIQLTASNIASSTVAHFVVIVADPNQSPHNVNFAVPAATLGFTVNNNFANITAPTRVVNGVQNGSITLNGSALGLPPLNFSWSLPSGAGSANCSFTSSTGPSTSTTVALTYTSVGSCNVTMTVTNSLGSASVSLPVTVSSSVSFSTIASFLDTNCSGCHGSAGPQFPSWVNDGGLYTRLTTTAGVVNTGTPSNSLLLVCPSVGCTEPNPLAGNPAPNQTMGTQSGFGSFGGFANYDTFLTWIKNGATNP